MKYVILLSLLVLPAAALAEGSCPPGQYPVGGQGVQGCAPIPSSGPAIPAPSRPTGKWDTRWGAIAQHRGPMSGGSLPIGVSSSRRSKGEAVAEAMEQCRGMGGTQCEVALSYHNQCAAMAGPEIGSVPIENVVTTVASGPVEAETKVDALKNCASSNNGRRCLVIYSACSMSEFKPFR